MTMPLERDIERKVKEYARSKGYLAYKFVSPGHSFVPDSIFISPSGKLFFIEFKRFNLKPTVMQEREHSRLREHGQQVYVIDTVDAGKRLVDATT